MHDQPPILGYATPAERPSGFALAPRWVIVLVAVIVPGLSCCLIRGRARALTTIALWVTVVIAFFFFGPVWDEVLFEGVPMLKGAGLYPFLFTCAAVLVLSSILALRDRRRVLGGCWVE